jgi:hypothetical protein
VADIFGALRVVREDHRQAIGLGRLVEVISPVWLTCSPWLMRLRVSRKRM